MAIEELKKPHAIGINQLKISKIIMIWQY